MMRSALAFLLIPSLTLLALAASPAAADIVFVPKPGSMAGGITVATVGQASVTGTVTETLLASLKIPAGTIGKNGTVQIAALWSYTNSSNTKFLNMRLGTAASAGGAGGTVFGQQGTTTSAITQTMALIRNNNATNAQVAFATTWGTPFTSSAAALTTGAIDTTVDTFINLTATNSNTGETITLVHAYAIVYPAP